MLQAGIQVSSVRKFVQTPQDVHASFSKFRAIGYTQAQLQWIGREVPASAVAEALRENGMTSWGVQDFYDCIRDDFDYYLGLCEATGGKYLCLSGIPDRLKENGAITMETIRRTAEELNALTEELVYRDMIATFHPRWQEFMPVNGRPAAAWLMEMTDPRFQLTLDLNHVVRAGEDPLEWIHRMKGRQDMVHYKDMVDTTREHSVLVPAGQGCLDGEAILEACRDAEVRTVFAEQETWDRDPFECLQESYRFLASHGVR